MSETEAIELINTARRMSARIGCKFVVSRQKLAMCGLSERAIERICRRFKSEA